VGQRIRAVLRNGFTVEDTLSSVGPYDLVLGVPGSEVLVPLHALLSWEPVQDANAPAP
jgi:sRNA-binding regulator protein Hfq